MQYILTFLASAVTFLGLDFFWIKFVAKPELDKIASSYLAEKPNLAAVAVFYVFYLVAVIFLVIKFSVDAKGAASLGFLVGLIAYGTYEFTNMSTLSNWSWKMVVLDTLWGGFLTAVVCLVGFVVYSRLS
ncbi:DUF2177 family protein [Candidatus Saccharibacteria bacterium]|jgi:uncharacterized membrane protein|nr:DUF2177 family protein [Candidatus Saccharibacteria bacterium]